MHGAGSAYNNWGLAITLIVISLFVILRFIPMHTRLGKRSGGALIAFFAALFAEMYGFPLTIYLFGHFVGIEIPLDHVSGHLLGDFISWMGIGNGWAIVMIASNVLILAGILFISNAWDRVYKSEGSLVLDGAYKLVRHPQYSGIFVITLGFMIQWPTFATLLLWPFVILMYVRLARREEQDVLKKFPIQYREYMDRTPMFIPRLFGSHRFRHVNSEATTTHERGQAQ
jgi:methanethiol S-methyltransferase